MDANQQRRESWDGGIEKSLCLGIVIGLYCNGGTLTVNRKTVNVTDVMEGVSGIGYTVKKCKGVTI